MIFQNPAPAGMIQTLGSFIGINITRLSWVYSWITHKPRHWRQILVPKSMMSLGKVAPQVSRNQARHFGKTNMEATHTWCLDMVLVDMIGDVRIHDIYIYRYIIDNIYTAYICIPLYTTYPGILHAFIHMHTEIGFSKFPLWHVSWFLVCTQHGSKVHGTSAVLLRHRSTQGSWSRRLHRRVEDSNRKGTGWDV